MLLGPRPFLPRLRRRWLCFVRLVHRYYGAVRPLQSVRVCLVALHLRRPASFPCGPRRSRGLPVLVPVVSQRARGLRLRRTDGSLAFIAKHRGAFLHQERVGILVLRFSKLNTRPTDTPVYASSGISRCRPQDGGPRGSRCLPSCRTLSFLTTCRFIPAHPNALTGCAVKRRWSTAGVNPPGNWFAPPGSNRSSSGGNEAAEAFGVEGRIGDLASMQAVT